MWRDDLAPYIEDNTGYPTYWDQALYDTTPVIVLRWEPLRQYNGEELGVLWVYLYDSQDSSFENLKDLKMQIKTLIEQFIENANDMSGIIWSSTETLLTLNDQNLIAWKFGGTTLVNI